MRVVLGVFVYLLCATLAMCFYVDPLDKDRTKWSIECRDSSGVTVGTMNNFKRGQIDNDVDLKEYLFCFAVKVGYMRENGDFDTNAIWRKMGSRLDLNIEDVITECTKFTGPSKERAFEMTKCLANYTS